GGSTLHELNHEDDNRDNQQEMDEAPQSIGGDQAQEPQHQQNDKDRPEHAYLLSSMYAGGVTCRCVLLSALRGERREEQATVQGLLCSRREEIRCFTGRWLTFVFFMFVRRQSTRAVARWCVSQGGCDRLRIL